MKRGILESLVVLVILGMTLTGCKDEVQQTAGEYSYKISGTVIADSVETHLLSETGALHVIYEDAGDLLLTFNVLGGDVYKTYADVANKEMKLQEFQRLLTVGAQEYKVTVTGSGEVHDKDLVLNLSYRGYQMQADSIKLEGDSLLLIATKN